MEPRPYVEVHLRCETACVELSGALPDAMIGVADVHGIPSYFGLYDLHEHRVNGRPAYVQRGSQGARALWCQVPAGPWTLDRPAPHASHASHTSLHLLQRNNLAPYMRHCHIRYQVRSSSSTGYWHFGPIDSMGKAVGRICARDDSDNGGGGPERLRDASPWQVHEGTSWLRAPVMRCRPAP